MTPLERYNAAAKRVADEERRKAQAEGAMGQIRQRWGEEYGVKTLKEADALATKLEQEAAEKDGAFEQGLAEFEQQYPESSDDS